MPNPKKYQKYFWPALAVVLAILLFMCHWSGDSADNTPPGSDIRLIDTFEYVRDCFPCDSTDVETMVLTGLECDGELYVEIGRWWQAGDEIRCDAPPCPEFPHSGAVEWDFYDSTYTLHKWFKSDNAPVNTMVPWSNSDRVNGVVWDGTPWRMEITNNLVCDIDVEFSVKVFEICSTEGSSSTDTTIPGFELFALLGAIVVSIMIIKKKKR